MAETGTTNKAQPPRTLKLRYFAILREQRGLSDEVLESTATTPRALYQDLANTHPFTLPPERVQVAINDQFSSMDTELSDGDVVVFVPPVAGG